VIYHHIHPVQREKPHQQLSVMSLPGPPFYTFFARIKTLDYPWQNFGLVVCYHLPEFEDVSDFDRLKYSNVKKKCFTFLTKA